MNIFQSKIAFISSLVGLSGSLLWMFLDKSTSPEPLIICGIAIVEIIGYFLSPSKSGKVEEIRGQPL